MNDETGGFPSSTRTFFDPYRDGKPGDELAEIVCVIGFLDGHCFPLGEALGILQVLEPPNGHLEIDRVASCIVLRYEADVGRQPIRIISFR